MSYCVDLLILSWIVLVVDLVVDLEIVGVCWSVPLIVVIVLSLLLYCSSCSSCLDVVLMSLLVVVDIDDIVVVVDLVLVSVMMLL